MKKLIKIVLSLLTALCVFAIFGVTWARIALLQEHEPLPPIESILLSVPGGDYASKLSWINTASQEMPRGNVLDPGTDPNPKNRYVMSHPSFVLEYGDGRILLIDAGMTRDGAKAFGVPLEFVGGAKPIEPLGSISERLGDARDRVGGIIFTHLHDDHTGGAPQLCEGRTENHPIRVFMDDAAAERPNYLTRKGLGLVTNAPCMKQVRLRNGPLLPVEGFPGVWVLAAGGHTPCSQVIIARVGTRAAYRTYVFVGDIANNIDGIEHNIPKPYLYSRVVVPEAPRRLDELRRYLKNLQDKGHFILLVSHDQLQIESTGIPHFGASQTKDTRS